MWKAIRHFPLIDYAEHFLIILNHSHDVAFLRFLMSWLAFNLFVCNSYNLGCYHLLFFPASDSQNMDQASIVSYVLAPNSVSYWNLKLEFPIIYGRHICKKLSILSLITICQILCYSTNYFRWSDWSSSFWNIICKLHLLQSIFSTRQFNGLSVAWEISKWVRRSRNQKMLASSEEKSWMVGDYHPPKRVNPGLNCFARAKITIDNTFDHKRMYFMDGFFGLDKIKILLEDEKPRLSGHHSILLSTNVVM